MSTFSGLDIALSSLYAQRQGLETTGQNVANANTEGYTRQRVKLVSVGAPTVPAIFSVWTGGGAGVSAAGVERMLDNFLESRGLQEHGIDAALKGTQTLLTRAQQAFPEPGDTGIQSQLSAFWAAWHDLANRPDDPAGRRQLLEQAATLATSLNQAADSLTKIRQSSADQLQSRVQEINSDAQQIASLNMAIVRATEAGMSPNELSDQRDLLISKLADIAGATVRYGDNGAADVFLGTTALVRVGDVQDITLRPGYPNDPDSTMSMVWTRDGTPV